MSKLAFSIPFLVFASACADSALEQSSAAQQLATACAYDVATATARLSDEVSLPGPGGGAGLAMACCTNPKGCTPMEYPTDTCWKLPSPVEATELTLYSKVAYASDTTTAFFSSCEDPPPEKCDPQETPYVFQPYSSTRWVVAFVPGPKGGTIAELYEVPENSTAVRIPSGAQVFPLLHEGEGYDDPTRPVETPDGTLFVDKQNDCIPRADGCGFTCSTC